MGRKNSYSEASIVRQILDYLNFKGYVCKRNNAGMMFIENPKDPRKKRAIKIGEVGFPDIEGITKQGRYFGIEVKRADGIVTDAQKATGDRIKKTGGIWFVARSLDDVIDEGF